MIDLCPVCGKSYDVHKPTTGSLCYCTMADYRKEIRELKQKLSTSESDLVMARAGHDVKQFCEVHGLLPDSRAVGKGVCWMCAFQENVELRQKLADATEWREPPTEKPIEPKPCQVLIDGHPQYGSTLGAYYHKLKWLPLPEAK